MKHRYTYRNIKPDEPYYKTGEEKEINYYKTESEYMETIKDTIVNVAKSYIGLTEIKNNMGFHDKTFNEKMISVGFRKGHPWCAYYTELVYKEAFNKFGLDYFDILDNLFSASTQKTWRNFKNKGEEFGFKIFKEPFPGDLVVWRSKRNSSFGHIGIVSTYLTNMRFHSVEGNTNDKGGREGYIVAERNRLYSFSKKRGLYLLGFIRYTL